MSIIRCGTCHTSINCVCNYCGVYRQIYTLTYQASLMGEILCFSYKNGIRAKLRVVAFKVAGLRNRSQSWPNVTLTQCSHDQMRTLPKWGSIVMAHCKLRDLSHSHSVVYVIGMRFIRKWSFLPKRALMLIL